LNLIFTTQKDWCGNGGCKIKRILVHLKMKNYFFKDILKGYVFEESYVLDISSSEKNVSFEIDALVSKEHKEFGKLKNKDQEYQFVMLEFVNCDMINWISLDLEKARSFDADKEIDYGSIDQFKYENNNYFLEGDWGQVKIQTDEVRLTVIQ